jgi:hypothetical protein
MTPTMTRTSLRDLEQAVDHSLDVDLLVEAECTEWRLAAERVVAGEQETLPDLDCAIAPLEEAAVARKRAVQRLGRPPRSRS